MQITDYYPHLSLIYKLGDQYRFFTKRIANNKVIYEMV